MAKTKKVDINKETFDKINSRIKYLGSTTFARHLATDLVNEGKNKLKQEYSFNLAIENIDVDGYMRTQTKGRIVASGNEVSFIEFGTGKVGEKSGYPKELLPSQTLKFESPIGYPQSTKGWEYYYDNPYTKVKHKGKYGWLYKKQFTRGMPAGKQVYTTAKYLRENIVKIAKQTIKEHTVD